MGTLKAIVRDLEPCLGKDWRIREQIANRSIDVSRHFRVGSERGVARRN